MNDPACDRLDDYLGGWLDGPARTEFEAHLEQCSACRQQAEQQRQLDALLSRAGSHLEDIPPVLIKRIERRLREARQRRLVASAASGLAAAALLILSVLILPDGPGDQLAGSSRARRPELRSPAAAYLRPAPAQPSPGVAELALFVTSRCQSPRPATHQWVRTPWFPSPPRPGHRRSAAPRRGGDDEEGKPANGGEETPIVVLNTFATDVLYIQSRRSLASRRLAGIAYQ